VRPLRFLSAFLSVHDVRVTPESGHVRCNQRCPLWAISEHLTLFDHLVHTWLPGDPKISEAGGVRRSETRGSLEHVADRVGGWCARRVVAGPALN
jgi:hypothetical protein